MSDFPLDLATAARLKVSHQPLLLKVRAMTTFEVKDMTCGHCIKAITQAIQALDPDARVQIDLPSQRVQVTSASSEADLSQAIVSAGYSPVAASAAAILSAPLKKAKGGCCCN
jgi:copper chaperone